MKKNVLYLLGLMLFSCNSRDLLSLEPIIEQSENRENDSNSVRSKDELLQIAEEAFAIIHPNYSRSSNYICSIDPLFIGNTADTLLYIVDFQNDNGYAIVSSKKETDGLIAITESGSKSDILENNGMEMFTDMAISYVTNSSKDSLLKPLPELWEYKNWTTTDTVFNFAPRISLKLGQHWPEGYYCPNKKSGCVTTAIAQAFSYFEQPSLLKLEYPERNKRTCELDWSDIKKHYSYGEYCAYSCQSEDKSHYELARLCRQLGYKMNATYKKGSTPINFDSVPNGIAEAGLKCSGRKELKDPIYLSEEFAKDVVVIMMGTDIRNDTVYGCHCWIVDGGFLLETTHYELAIPPYVSVDDEPIENISYSKSSFVHINWGWNGNSNGYFNEKVLKTATAIKYDDNFNFEDYNFEYDLYYYVISKK